MNQTDLSVPFAETKGIQADIKLGPKILIVEDDTAQQPIWTHVIEAITKDPTIVWVSSEESAERAIRNYLAVGQRFDVIIADVYLNGKRTGIDLWRRYGKNGPKFLLVSGAAMPELDKLIPEGIHPAFLKKPITVEALKSAIKSILPEQKGV